MLLLALLSAFLSPMFPLVAFPCYFLPALIPLTQLCECCLPQEKLQSPDQQSKTGGFWELHMCGGEPAGKGQLHWHCQRPKQWVQRPKQHTQMYWHCCCCYNCSLANWEIGWSKGAIAKRHVTMITCMKNNCPHMWPLNIYQWNSVLYLEVKRI